MHLLDFLVDRGAIDEIQRARVLALRVERGESETVLITRLGMLDEREMAECLAKFMGIPLAGSTDYPTAAICPHLNAEFIVRARVIPIRETPEAVCLAMADPTDTEAVKAVRLAASKPVFPWVALPTELAAALSRLYGVAENQPRSAAATRPTVAGADLRRLDDLASDEPVIRYVNWLIGHAVAARASDVHVEAGPDRLILRMRIDGVLRDLEPPPRELQENIVGRVKVMAGLNIAEQRLPQDGRFRIVVEGRDIDLRISVLPTLHGEGVVLRVLDRASTPLDLAGLGFDAALREQFERLLHLPSGMLLVTGPTGSGKTSTLYAALQTLNERGRKILTIEDPVEYALSGINQIPVRPEIGLNFATLLRSVLRHDPDVMLVGEIRDAETARIAAQSALTGHLLLSTLHTNDAVSAVIRLIDMGLEPYLVAAVLKGVMAQRLVRRLCPSCRKPATLSPAPSGFGNRHGAFYIAKGCDACEGTGYRGRTAIGELLLFNENLAQLILARTDVATLTVKARTGGMATLYSDGLAKAQAGLTSIEEVLRVAPND